MPQPTPRILPTGFPRLDEALGGGIPFGRVTEIGNGPYRNLLLAGLLTEAQRLGPGRPACYIDGTHDLDVVEADRLGVNVSQLLVAQPQPESYDACLQVLEDLVRSDAVSLVVLRLPPGATEGEERIWQARRLGHVLRSVTAMATRNGTAVVVAPEEWRDLAPSALKFYASVRIALYRSYARIVKNKLAPPFETARDWAEELFVCECPLDSGETRRLCRVTDHEGGEHLCRYCPDCVRLAETDWNGETASIEPVYDA